MVLFAVVSLVFTVNLLPCYMEGGCLGYPGASTVASQPLDRIPLPWLANPRNPAMSPHSRHLSTLIESVEGEKEKRGGGWGNAGREDRFNKPAKNTNAKHVAKRKV